MAVQTQIQARRGTAATWTSTNPTLAAGETGYETDTGKFKIGTGSTAWASLGYFNQDPVTTKGDLFTFSTTDARLAVGANGETLVADSATATGLRYNASANANLIAGGSFDIWQRGTGPFTSGAIYTSDRFYVYSQSSYSLSQESSVVPEGATYAAKITTTAGSSFANMQFALEQSEVEKLAGKTVTFSVYLRANATYNGTTALQILYNATGNTQTGGTWALVSGAATTHTPSTSAYTRVSVTGTIPTSAKGLAFYIGQQSVLANGSILYIGLAKAELGSVATPFVRCGGTIQGELAATMRYFQKSYEQATAPATATNNGRAIAQGGTVVSNGLVCGVIFPVVMRGTPTITIYSANGTSGRVDNLGGTDQGAGSGTAFVPTQSGFGVQNQSGGSITTSFNGFGFQYTASAEL